MKKLILFLTTLLTVSAFAQDNTLSSGMMPAFYKKRAEPILNIGLVYYGDYYTMADLERVQKLFEQRFFEATGNALKINTVSKAILPFKNKIENFPEYRQEYVTEIDRLQRLWYYDNVGMGIMNEVYSETKKSPEIDLDKLDVMLVITGAQFDGLGFASGRVAVTENPMEIAWGLENGGRVEHVSDAKVVDELIHEMGHTLYLDHVSKQCHQDGMGYEAQLACCKTSVGKDDVLSYCRNREKVDTKFFYGFKECNRKKINEKIIPAILQGGKWNIGTTEDCE